MTWSDSFPPSFDVGDPNAGHMHFDSSGTTWYGPDGTSVELRFDTATGNIVIQGSVSNATNAINLTGGGTVSGSTLINGSLVVGPVVGSHAVVGTDGHGADGFRLYGSDGVTPLIDLSISGTPTITGSIIETATSGQRIVMGGPPYGGMQFFSGAAGETAPAQLIVGGTPGLSLQTGTLSGGSGNTATLQVIPNNGVQIASVTATIGANQATLFDEQGNAQIPGKFRCQSLDGANNPGPGYVIIYDGHIDFNNGGGYLTAASNGSGATDGAYLEYFPPTSGSNTAAILRLTAGGGSALSTLYATAVTTRVQGSLLLDAALSATVSPYIQGPVNQFIGLPNGANQVITGLNSGDIGFRTNGGAFSFSNNNGGSVNAFYIGTDGHISTGSYANINGLLDVSDAAASAGTNGAGIGDKISLYASGAFYGIGIQSGRTVLYVGSNANSVSARAAVGSGQQSGSGTFAPMTASAFTVNSTRDSKTDVTPLGEEHGLAMVRKITPVRFRSKNFTGHPMGDWRTSFVAEDVVAHLPEVGGWFAQDMLGVADMKLEGIDLGAMVPVLWRAVQELSDKVERLAA